MDITATISLIVALSVASERLVEIFKGFFPSLDEKRDTVDEEAWRRAILHLIAMGAGVLTASFAYVADIMPSSVSAGGIPAILALGLLTSGGSGFWNSILDYVNKVKDIKKAQAKEETIKANEAGLNKKMSEKSETVMVSETQSRTGHVVPWLFSNSATERVTAD